MATNPPPPEIAAMLHAACYDCHSSETKWPWYSRLAPMSWLIAGDVNKPTGAALLRAAHSTYQPNKVVMGTAGKVEEFAKSLPDKGGALVYLCTGRECQAPTSEPARVREMLSKN